MALRRARYERARALLDRAHAGFEAGGLRRHAASVSTLLAEIDFREGHPPQAVARLETALADLEGDEPDEDVAVVEAQLGRFLVLNAQTDAALPHLERALELAEALRLPEVFVQTLTSKSILYSNVNRLGEARILLEGALARAFEQDLHAAAARTVNNLGVVLESEDRYGEVIVLGDRGLELARQVGDRAWEAQLLAGFSSSFVLLGRWDEALARLTEVEGASREDASILSLLTHFVDVHCERGDLGRAREQLAHPALEESEDLQIRVGLSNAKARILRAEGRPREALEAAESAFAARTELGITSLGVKLALVHALEAAFELGDTEKVRELVEVVGALRPGERPLLLDAHAHRFRAKLDADDSGFEAAEAQFRDLGTAFWLAVTLLEHAEVLVAQDRAGEAEPLLTEARGIFERLEARPWLDRVEKVGPTAQVTA